MLSIVVGDVGFDNLRKTNATTDNGRVSALEDFHAPTQ